MKKERFKPAYADVETLAVMAGGIILQLERGEKPPTPIVEGAAALISHLFKKHGRKAIMQWIVSVNVGERLIAMGIIRDESDQHDA